MKKRHLDKKTWIFWLLVGLWLLTLFGCASSSPAAGAPSETAQTSAPAADEASADNTSEKELFPLRAASPTGFNEIYIADAMGFLAEEGIQIEFIGALGQGVTEFQLLGQGEVDVFTAGHPPAVAQSQLAGLDAIAVAPGMIDDASDPHVRYLVQKDSPIQSLDEAVGKKVSISSVSACSDGYVRYYLKSKGLDAEQVEFVTLNSPGQQEQALSQGLVDITTSHPPFAGIALAAGNVREITNTWEIFHDPGAGVSVRGFTKQFIEEYPDVVQGYVNALYKARIWTNDNLDEAKRITATYLDIDPEDLSSFYYEPKKNIDPAYIDKWFEISEEIGLWNHGDISPEDIYTNEFVPEDIPAP